MKHVLRRLFATTAKFAAITAAVVIGSAAYTLNERGLSYAETQAFQGDLILYAKVGAVLALILFLIVLCFRITGKRWSRGAA